MKRIEYLQQRLKDWKIDFLLIENPIDLFYLTHLDLSKGRLWVGHDGAQLHVDGRYFGEASRHFRGAVFLWIRGNESPRSGVIGFDSAWTTVDGWEALKKESPNARWTAIASPVLEQRLIKDAEEVVLLQKAAQITWGGIQHIRSLFRDGVSEQELAMEFEFFVRQHGASRLSFDTVVAFGENSAYPHHRASSERLKKNQIVLIDAGATYQSYCADVTRVYFFGEPDPRLMNMLHLVREAGQIAQREVRLGAAVGSLDKAVRCFFREAGVEDLFTHSLGHGIGLETHELPTIRQDSYDCARKIQRSMTIAIEPGLYQPGVGGVRYENSGVVTEAGFESFYPSAREQE
jgi:Xaa-Pro aminopeptidase